MAVTVSAQLLAQGQFGMVIIPLSEIGVWLGTDDPGELSWIAASFGYARARRGVGKRMLTCSLSVGMFLVASGRLGDI